MSLYTYFILFLSNRFISLRKIVYITFEPCVMDPPKRNSIGSSIVNLVHFIIIAGYEDFRLAEFRIHLTQNCLEANRWASLIGRTLLHSNR